MPRTRRKPPKPPGDFDGDHSWLPAARRCQCGEKKPFADHLRDIQQATIPGVVRRYHWPRRRRM